MMTKPLLLIFTLTMLPLSAQAMSKKAPANTTPTAQASTAPAEPADTLWVGKSDDAKSCGKDRGVDIDLMAGELQGKSVKIFAKKKLSDGKMRIQMCGADKGNMNGFLISRKDLDKAKELGFKPVAGNF